MTLNVICAACVASLLGWFFVSLHAAPAVVPHIVFLLALAVALWLLINWFSHTRWRLRWTVRGSRFIAQVGLVSAKGQRVELGLEGDRHEKRE